MSSRLHGWALHSPSLSQPSLFRFGCCTQKGWWLEVNLPFIGPLNSGSSINDYINPEYYSLKYCTIDNAITILNELGPGTLMGKIDLKNAFRLCPDSKEDWPLLGIYWQGNYYLDKSLPFGLGSAPFLFNQLASGLEWILVNNYGVQWLLHYLDDIFTAGPPGTDICHKNMQHMLSLCSHVNAAVKPEKVEGPTTLLTFLGVLLDTVTMQASITQERKAEIVQALLKLQGKHTCTKKLLLSVIGQLAFACKVVPPGRIFLRHLIDLSTTVGPIHHHVTINQEARKDIQWWIDFSLIGQVQVSSVNPIGPQHMTWTSIQMRPTRDLEHTGWESGLTPPGQPARFNNQLHGERCLRSLSHVPPGVLTGNGKMYYFTVTTGL